ncbi:hypothetical protein N9112_00325 [bacterium]|nr:hypothetical protein [bacterium]
MEITELDRLCEKENLEVEAFYGTAEGFKVTSATEELIVFFNMSMTVEENMEQVLISVKEALGDGVL